MLAGFVFPKKYIHSATPGILNKQMHFSRGNGTWPTSCLVLSLPLERVPQPQQQFLCCSTPFSRCCVWWCRWTIPVFLCTVKYAPVETFKSPPSPWLVSSLLLCDQGELNPALQSTSYVGYRYGFCTLQFAPPAALSPANLLSSKTFPFPQ